MKVSFLAVNTQVARAIIRKLHVALWPKRLDTPGVRGVEINRDAGNFLVLFVVIEK